MNVVKCSQGHFYDADKFTVCPHCGVAQQELTQSNSVVRKDETVALREEEIQAWEYKQEMYENSTVKGKRTKGTFLGKKRKSEVFSGQNESVYTGPITIKTATIQQTIQTEQPMPMSMTGAPVVAAHVAAPVRERGCTVGWLIFLNGKDKGTTCELKSGNNFIGSGADMDVQIRNDSKVAHKNHAKIVFEPNKQEFFVAPGDSSELVYLGEDVVMIPQKLAAYDRIIIGDTTMLFMPLCGEKFTWQGER